MRHKKGDAIMTPPLETTTSGDSLLGTREEALRLSLDCMWYRLLRCCRSHLTHPLREGSRGQHAILWQVSPCSNSIFVSDVAIVLVTVGQYGSLQTLLLALYVYVCALYLQSDLAQIFHRVFAVISIHQPAIRNTVRARLLSPRFSLFDIVSDRFYKSRLVAIAFYAHVFSLDLSHDAVFLARVRDLDGLYDIAVGVLTSVPSVSHYIFSAFQGTLLYALDSAASWLDLSRLFLLYSAVSDIPFEHHFPPLNTLYSFDKDHLSSSCCYRKTLELRGVVSYKQNKSFDRGCFRCQKVVGYARRTSSIGLPTPWVVCSYAGAKHYLPP